MDLAAALFGRRWRFRLDASRAHRCDELRVIAFVLVGLGDSERAQRIVPLFPMSADSITASLERAWARASAQPHLHSAQIERLHDFDDRFYLGLTAAVCTVSTIYTDRPPMEGVAWSPA